MELKKNPHADLESKRSFFVQIGLIFTLAVVLLAFEWKTYERVITDLGPVNVVVIEEEDIPITRQETPPPPPPPTPTTILNIVEDDVEIEVELNIDAEATETTEIVEYVPVVVEEAPVEAEIFLVVEDPAQFPGGESARMKFLTENIKYPQIAREMGIQGTVYVTFVVEPTGKLTGLKVLRGIGGGCDEEAMRVVGIMPKWQPGKQRGQNVRVQFNMPIRFVLQ